MTRSITQAILLPLCRHIMLETIHFLRVCHFVIYAVLFTKYHLRALTTPALPPLLTGSHERGRRGWDKTVFIVFFRDHVVGGNCSRYRGRNSQEVSYPPTLRGERTIRLTTFRKLTYRALHCKSGLNNESLQLRGAWTCSIARVSPA